MKFPQIGKVKRPWLWLTGVLLLGLLTAGVISALVWRQRSAQYDVATLTTIATDQPLTVRITTSGTVQPVQTVNLSPRTQGILQTLYVEQGDRVETGQLIARMKRDDVEAQVAQNRAAVAEARANLQQVQRGSRPEEIAQAEANVGAAQAQVREARSRLDLAQSQFDRNQQLYDRGAISINDLDTTQRELRSAQATVEQLQAQVKSAQDRLQDLRTLPEPEDVAQAQAQLDRADAQLQAAQVQLQDTEIRAPFAGIITQKFATEGAFVTPTTSASDATSATSTAIVALAKGLEVLAEVPEADINQIYPDQAVEIRADAFPDQVFKGQVRLIAPEAVERQSVTLFQVRVDLLSGAEQLRSNMNVTVDFIGDKLEAALVVPTVAIITQGGQTGVLVPGEHHDIRFRPVTLGPQVGDKIQILSGIESGQRVFVDLPPGKTLENLTFGQEKP